MMTSTSNQTTTQKTQRWIGKLETSPSLPSVVFFGGIHGNERSGITAIERVLNTIVEKNMSLKGNIYALRGNLKAIETGQRFIEHDLNRLWTQKKVEKAKAGKLDIAESSELLEIVGISEELIYNTEANITFVDLHTTSSDSSPFIVMDDTIRNRKLAQLIPATIVLGVLEQLKGTLSGFLGNYGATTVVFEAGQHFAASSIDRHEAAIWLLLHGMKIVDTSQIDIHKYKKLLQEACAGKPKVVESRLRFGLEETDTFEMQPGFTNFSPVKKGQRLATFNNKDLYADFSGRIFMPLYQKQGDDGFFLTKRISPFWQVVSEWLRTIKADRFVHLLPGVTKHPSTENTFVINQKVASFKTMQVLHLLGFRKEKKVGKTLVVNRRPFDLKGPWD